MTAPATSDDRKPGGGGNRPMDELQVPDSSTVLKHVGVPFDDIVIDILSRLPVKTLIRFKSLSRNWTAAIPNNPNLISLHRKNYSDKPTANNRSSLLCAYRIRPPAPQLWPQPKRAISFSPDLQPTNSDGELASRVICSAGEAGAMLLGYPSMTNPDYCLWNPATRQIRQLPDPYDCVPNVESQKFNTYGVGLDAVSNDIKVVLISAQPRVSSRVLVYTLGSGCWKEIEGGYPFHENGEHLTDMSFTCPTYFKGSVYWLCGGTYVRWVVAFDMGTDSFRRINCNFPYDSMSTARLFIYRDSIALLNKQYYGDNSVGVWLLRSSGLGSNWSWIKHSTLDPSVGLYLSLWTCLNGNQFVGDRVKIPPFPYNDTTRNYELVVVDITGGAREIAEVLIPSCLRVDRCFSYRETLVPLSSK